VSPVPDYIYQSQPRYGSSEVMFYANKGPHLSRPANWTCPRTAPYEPILAIPVETLRIDPAWANCLGGINGAYDPPKALTPADAIAKPTLAERIPETTSEAIPASTARPILAIVTPAVESNKMFAPASTGETQDPRLDSPDVNEGSTAPRADVQQPDDHDSTIGNQATIPKEPSRSIAPVVYGLPTQLPEGAETRPIENTVADVPGSTFPDPNDGSKPLETNTAPRPQIDALSVLLTAQSSINAETRQQGHDEQVNLHGGPGLPATRTEAIKPAKTFESPPDGVRLSGLLDPVILSMVGNNPATMSRPGSSAVLQNDASAFTAPSGSEFSIVSHAFGLASDGEVIVIDFSVTHPITASNVQSFTLATFAAGDNAITAYGQDSFVVLADGTQTLTAQLGSAVTIGSDVINIATEGHALVFGSSTVDIPSDNEVDKDVSATVQTTDGSWSPAVATTSLQNGQKLSAFAAESSIVVQQGTSLVTLAAWQETTFNGHPLSAAQSGAALIVDGSTMTLPPTKLPAGSSEKVKTGSNSRSANAAGAAGATETVEVTTSRPSTTQSSVVPDSAARGSMANASLFLRLQRLIVCVRVVMALI
jgi:hypothetical protein